MFHISNLYPDLRMHSLPHRNNTYHSEVNLLEQHTWESYHIYFSAHIFSLGFIYVMQEQKQSKSV